MLLSKNSIYDVLPKQLVGSSQLSIIEMTRTRAETPRQGASHFKPPYKQIALLYVKASSSQMNIMLEFLPNELLISRKHGVGGCFTLRI